MSLPDTWGATFSKTRPPFEALIPPRPKLQSVPVTTATLEKIRKKVYEKAVSLKDVFRRFDKDKDGTVSREEFKTCLLGLNLQFSEKEINGLMNQLDEDEGGSIAYQEFAAMLKTKDTEGEYNPFLLERTYFDGCAVPEDTGQERYKKLTAQQIADAYKLHENISKRFYLKYKKPSIMFRDVDENSNGAISSEEFTEKLKALNIETTPEEVNKMIDVLQMPQPGQLTYDEFVEYFQQPDKWGFCSPWNPVLRLGKNGEKGHKPMDSTTMQKDKWDKEGRPEPRELLRKKKEMIKELIAEGKTMHVEQPTHTIVLPGKTKKGYLDKYLLAEIRRKFTTMRKSTRDMFRILDPAQEGRISKENFHKCMQRLNMGIPEPVLDELISFVDSDNCGYVEMPEFIELIQPSSEDMRLPSHNEEDIAEIEQLLSKPPGADGIPKKELHPIVVEYLQNGEMKPTMFALLQEGIARKSTRLRDVFLKWDIDQDGFIDSTELRKGLSSLNLGIPQVRLHE